MSAEPAGSEAATAAATVSDAAPRSRAFLLTLAFCSALCLVPLWAFDYLPMVDLPQNAAQVAIWQRWDDGAFPYSDLLAVNRATPYLLAYVLAYALALVMPVATAFKLLVSAGILGVPFATLLLLRESRGNPWWVFVCFPVGFSFNFYWGFVNYVIATPLALLFVVAALRYAERPTWRRGLGLFLFVQLMFVAHVILFGLCGLLAAAIVLLRAPSFKAALVRWLPLVAALPVCVAWLYNTRSSDAMTREPTAWEHGWRRLPELVSLVVGLPPGAVALLSAALLAAIPFLLGARPSRQLYRWLPLLLVVALFLAAPYKLLGTTLVYERFAVLVLPTLLFALDHRPAAAYPPWRRALAPLLAAGWIVALAVRFWGFHLEVDGFKNVIREVPENRRLLYFSVLNSSEFIPYPVFVYFGVWYQVERGGMVDFSFADFFPPRFRYRPERKPPLPALFRWRPWLFRFDQNGGTLYDYYLVRSPVEVGGALFAGASEPIVPVRREGQWWLYRRGGAPAAGAAPAAAPNR